MADIDDVDDALFAALAALERDDAHTTRPFALVTRFTGQVQMTPGGITLQREAVGRLPAVLWQWVGEDVTTQVQTLLGAREDYGTAQWIAWVLMQDARGSTKQVKGATGTLGVHALNDAVVSALNGVADDTLFRASRVRVARSRAFVAERGVHVTQITIEARRALPQADVADDSVDLTEIRGDVNLEGTDDEAPNPVVQFRADTTD